MEYTYFGRNLKALRERAGHTQQSLADALGIQQNTVSGWETRGKKPRNPEISYHLMELLDCTERDLYGFADGYYSSRASQKPMATASIPLLGHVHAGDPEEPTEAEDTVLVPDWLVERDPQCYALIADGDCMDKVYPEGCTIIISPCTEPKNGCVAVVSIDGREAVMRRMYRTASTLVLSPESHNPEHKDIVITDSDIWIDYLGTVVWMQGEV